MSSSFTRELFKIAARPEVISLAGGSPSPDLLPVEYIRQAADKVLQQQGRRALQYSITEGLPEMREWIASRFAAQPENVQVTSGSQQALDLVAKTLIDPGDKILIESPTYLGAIQAFNAYQPQYLNVSVDGEGTCVDELEPLLKQKPKFFYVLTNFHNPVGSTLTLERRKKLVELCRQYQVPILEDDAYHYLSFDGEVPPTLYELDAQLGGGNVFYTSTFSKTVAPGLRVAWIVGPKVAVSKICQMKQGTDSHTSALSQLTVVEVAPYIETVFVPQIRPKYKLHSEAMLSGLKKHLPQTQYTIPKGGMFYWVKLPAGLDSFKLLEAAIAQNVAFVPGAPFYANGQGHDALRLSFSSSNPERIHEGLERIAKAVESLTVVG